MSSIATRLQLLLLLAACILSTSACRTLSTTPSIVPTPPIVDCRQPATPRTPPAPKADEWVSYDAALQAARLSEPAVAWIADVLGLLGKERALRGVESDCLDALEAKGAIRQ